MTALEVFGLKIVNRNSVGAIMSNLNPEPYEIIVKCNDDMFILNNPNGLLEEIPYCFNDEEIQKEYDIWCRRFCNKNTF